MILDNKNSNDKVFKWIERNTETGQFDMVTGYFTAGTLAWLARVTDGQIDKFRIVLGDIVSFDVGEDTSLDLLGQNITIDAALTLNQSARQAVSFIRKSIVQARTLEPNFCHAKVYLFQSSSDPRHHYFISGSSNLTEAGIGLKAANNVEMNLAETGEGNQYKELVQWFDDLWNSKEAHDNKTIVDTDGKKHIIPFKEYLIDNLQKLFAEYTPRQIYFKVLHELFGSQLKNQTHNPDFNRQVGRLENTSVYNALYEFQRKGVLSLILMLQKYGGAILADAVGLGKTWSALAVMKFFQMQGHEVVLICPKKLEHNWRRFQRNQESRFEADQLDFFIRFHTDLQPDRLEKYNDRFDKLFFNDRPKLFVIDESHNLRNAKSLRYQHLVDEILSKNQDARVLMLSATPINNTLIDIRNQFKLIKQGDKHGFDEDFDIRNIDYLFNRVQKKFFEWQNSESPKVADFINMLPQDFFKLTDALTVARTRKMIVNQEKTLTFPKKNAPQNIFVTPKQIGNYNNFAELIDNFPPFMSAYQPAFYIDQAEDVKKINDERQRDRFLVKMMYILLVKRLESSWYSFQSTVDKILVYHTQVFHKLHMYKPDASGLDTITTDEGIDIIDDNDMDSEESLTVESLENTVGKRRPIPIAQIDQAGKLKNYKDDLEQDIKALQTLKENLNHFDQTLRKELATPSNQKSIDVKLEKLMDKIRSKQQSGNNGNNQKVLIFTVYKDTAFYLFDQLKARGFAALAVVSGDESQTDDMDGKTKQFEPILNRFSPYAKLYKERDWEFEPQKENPSKEDHYNQWQQWTKDHVPEIHRQLQKPIDILIATDALSEGQNLQDCDMVVNYDIHWNPVRVIQRMGRIDRLGSPNKEIFGINFWPDSSIDNYLRLQSRVEERMSLMKLGGAEVPENFSQTFKDMAEDQNFEARMNERMLRQMQNSWDQVDEHESGLSFDDLSLESFRLELLEELRNNSKYYQDMPNGVFTGFQANRDTCPSQGIIALLGFPAKATGYERYQLVYIDEKGQQVLDNQKEILTALAEHRDQVRYVSQKVDSGDPQTITSLSESLKIWLKKQVVNQEKMPDGTIKERAGQHTMDLLDQLKTGDSQAINAIKNNQKASNIYRVDNCDLVAWFLV